MYDIVDQLTRYAVKEIYSDGVQLYNAERFVGTRNKCEEYLRRTGKTLCQDGFWR